MSSSSFNSQTTNKGKVISKYFNEGKSALDESILDFQETKKSCKGPKTNSCTASQKPSGTTKSKKASKKIKGQKDIRSVLKPKKHELEAYTKDFDKVCKASGIDIDSEQLQVAIALSKSLQDTNNAQENCSQSSGFRNPQERNGRIRTTLLEYGFKVPEIKIETTRRKGKSRKKNSKLLLITGAERQQIITDRFFQVLFESANHANIVCSNLVEHTSSLYELASNKSYEYLKSNKTFYVKDLIEISPYSIGTLLRNWSEIPGRPISPVKENNDELKFTDMDFEMDEIDLVLSGPLNKAQEVVKSKRALLKHELSKVEAIEFKVAKEVVIDISEDSYSPPLEVNDKAAPVTQQMELLAPTQSTRCASPDLFDDELSSVTDNTKETYVFSQKSPQSSQDDFQCTSQPISLNLAGNVRRKKSNDYMDLTKCVPHIDIVYTMDSVPNSQKTDVTKRKSDDFMEITDCVDVCEQNNPTVAKENIDLTQVSEHDEADYTTIVQDINITVKVVDSIEKLDLTQSSNSNDDTLPFVQISGHKPKNNIVIEAIDTNENSKMDIAWIDVDVLQSNNEILLEQSLIKARDSKSSKECSVFEEYLFEHSDHSSKENNTIITEIKENIDLTQNSNISEEIPICKSIHLTDDKNSLGKMDDVSIDYDEVCLNQCRNADNSQHRIDFSIGLYTENPLENSEVFNIDHEYKEVIENEEQQGSISEQSLNKMDTLSNLPLEVFEISDEEMNYSMHKCKHIADHSGETNEISYEISKENFDFGGISITNNISSHQADKFQSTVHESVSNGALNKSASDSFFPVVDIKGTKVKMKSPEKTRTSTPLKDIIKEKLELVHTPSNSEYVVKTDQVTPMVDYASLSTPDRNKELEKYGLKPFKRKRAIQLLTHLYNQTHPFVETFTSEELPSPSKKQKCSQPAELQTLAEKSVTKSPRKQIRYSPKKIEMSPKKNLAKSSKDSDEASTSVDVDKEDGATYDETQQTPVIQEVRCSPEDWVFQKRMKAKVSSCPVPLHISLHNYVSCRRALRDAILRYEPVDIHVIHKELISAGHRYDPKDLLRFLDKRCITVKTADNTGRNNKRCQRKS